MQNIKKILQANIFIIAMLLLGFSWLSLANFSTVEAAEIKSNICGGAKLTLSDSACGEDTNKDGTISDGERAASDAAPEKKLNKLIASIVNILSVIVGIIAVIMIIIGGLKFITSGGDSGKVSSAKSTVIYAIIGLIIVALAQFIVRFVLSKT